MIDISLGVMRDGVGSMSKEDIWIRVIDKDHLKILREASESGKIVKVKYNTVRFPICYDADRLTEVQVVE